LKNREGRNRLTWRCGRRARAFHFFLRLIATGIPALLLIACGEFRAFDWTPLARLPEHSVAGDTEEIILQPADVDDTYAPIPGRQRRYRWTTEGPLNEGIRLVVYESAQRGWQARDGFWDWRTLQVALGAPKPQVTHIADVGAYTLFLTNLGQLIAFDHRSEHFCRRAISAGTHVTFVLQRVVSSEHSPQTDLIVGTEAAAGRRYRLDLGWLCEYAAPTT